VCPKQVVGWQVRADMPETLVTTALRRALLAQRPSAGLIIHSDRGGQYVGNAYQALLRDAKAHLSHSSRGECSDNTQAESRWSRLKTELLELRDWPAITSGWATPCSNSMLSSSPASCSPDTLIAHNRR